MTAIDMEQLAAKETERSRQPQAAWGTGEPPPLLDQPGHRLVDLPEEGRDDRGYPHCAR